MTEKLTDQDLKRIGNETYYGPGGIGTGVSDEVARDIGYSPGYDVDAAAKVEEDADTSTSTDYDTPVTQGNRRPVPHVRDTFDPAKQPRLGERDGYEPITDEERRAKDIGIKSARAALNSEEDA